MVVELSWPRVIASNIWMLCVKIKERHLILSTTPALGMVSLLWSDNLVVSAALENKLHPSLVPELNRYYDLGK